MRLTEKQEKRLVGVAWVDYFKGYPKLCDCRVERNNWRKIHGLPMVRKTGIKK